MIWFLIALVTYTTDESPDLKIHGGLTFYSLQECNNYKEQFESALAKDLYRIYPNIKSYIIKCIDNESAKKMREQLSKNNW